MATQAGTYRLGPGSGTLSVRTGRKGAASKAGHDLLIEVTSWDATLAVGEDPADTSIELSADGGSLRVREGTGGMQALDDGDRANIQQTIDDEVLRRQGITFRSSRVQPGGDGGLHAEGDLTLLGQVRPIAFDVALGADGAITASAIVKQSNWGMKPYSALFGALKVADEVEVNLAATLSPPQSA
jgi:polyisoprenoid-binding protein YceI